VTFYKKRLLLTVALIPVINLSAQTVYPEIVVKFPTKSNLVKYFPYLTVRIIDHRMDTTKIYPKQTGIYLLRQVNPIHSNTSAPSCAGANGGGLLIGLIALFVVEAINDGLDNSLNKKMEKD
jgi:hypothetical protein